MIDPTYFCPLCAWSGTRPVEVVARMEVRREDEDVVRLECRACGKEVHEATPCGTCGLAESFYGIDDCVACAVAYDLLHCPQNIEDMRELLSRKDLVEELKKFNAEVERQLAGIRQGEAA